MFLEEAIVDAKEACGLITDYKGNKVWTFEENYGE